MFRQLAAAHPDDRDLAHDRNRADADKVMLLAAGRRTEAVRHCEAAEGRSLGLVGRFTDPRRGATIPQ